MGLAQLYLESKREPQNIRTRHSLFDIRYFLCIFFFASCAVSPGLDAYHALDRNDIGYSEEEIGPKRFEIHYSGTWKQSYAILGRYSLVRSAELAREMGFSFFSIESFSLGDEPEIRILKTCSDIRVTSDSVVSAALVTVQYLANNEPRSPTVVFSVDKIMQMRPLLLDENKAFDLIAFLDSRQVQVTN